jgi:hypothetical protein
VLGIVKKGRRRTEAGADLGVEDAAVQVDEDDKNVLVASLAAINKICLPNVSHADLGEATDHENGAEIGREGGYQRVKALPSQAGLRTVASTCFRERGALAVLAII